MSATIDYLAATFSKTEIGQQRMQLRTLDLPPLMRRILVLVDGQRSGKDLAGFASGNDVVVILIELLNKGYIEAGGRTRVAAPASSASASSAPTSQAVVGQTSTSAVAQAANGLQASSLLESLPPAENRSAEQNEMARNFMVNTVNAIFGQNTRISLVKSISEAQGTTGLRQAYLQWQHAMNESRAAAKRLPEFLQKLASVL